jgi:hypothetical protein
MKRSETRILTTHTGSLPRPATLTDLFVARAGGAPVDEKRIEAEGRAAVAAALARQRECGIDVAGNGEQQRESFVLYLRHRLGGLGGQGTRTAVADVEGYPEFRKARSELLAARPAVSNFAQLPKTVGPIVYAGHRALDDECDTFARALDAEGSAFEETFMTAPSPGILAAIVENEHYDSNETYIAAVGDALRVEYERIVERGHLLQLDCPDLALERHVSFKAKPLPQFLAFGRRRRRRTVSSNTASPRCSLLRQRPPEAGDLRHRAGLRAARGEGRGGRLCPRLRPLRGRRFGARRMPSGRCSKGGIFRRLRGGRRPHQCPALRRRQSARRPASRPR